MAKVIRNFNIDLSNMVAESNTRTFQVIGDNGAIFSLEVTNELNEYYNFSTKTFSATHKRLKNRRVDNGVYNGSITFPTITDDDHYNIYVFAESMHDTVHTEYSEVRFSDGSIDINSSTGSNSNLLKKIIYQYTDTTITLSAISPSGTHHSTGNFVSMAVSSDTITVGRGGAVGKTAFSVGVTVAATKVLQINRQPTISDLTAYTSVTMGSGVIIPGEDIWGGEVRSTDQTMDGGGSAITGTVMTMDVNCSTIMKVGDRVTGNTALDAKTGSSAVTVTVVGTGGDAKDFTISESITIADNEALTFTPPYYYRWSIDSASSIHKLLPGMGVVDSNNTITPSTIGPYKDTTTYTTETHNEDGSIEEVTNIVTNVSIPALDPLGYKPTITNGLVTQQLGYITFNGQIENDLASQTTYFYAYGPDTIKTIHNTTIKLTDLKVELTAPTTTVTIDSSDTTIPVANREGVINDISTISGIGIDTTLARSTDTVDGAVSNVTKIVMDNNVATKMVVGDRVEGDGIPTSSTVTVIALNPDGDNVKAFSVSEAVSILDEVTLTFTPYALPIITSGGGATGAGDWTIGTSQVLPQNTVLTVGGTSRTATITGNIEFVNVDDTDFTLHFDVNKFLTAS
jgi:hypothetical protein